MNVYAEVKSAFQQVGGVCPEGWLLMQSDRPSPDHIASEDGIWSVPVRSSDDQRVTERAWRNAELTSVTWLRERHRDQQELGVDTTLSSEQFVELLAYMQALRAWPQSSDFPDSAHRPMLPRWIADHTE
ncbi:phage tail assembly chaperone [Pseudomonas sp. EL_65y_Pfl1_R83]|uniref:phage tail assembly chaperone n=1 Tax=Pseudomonas sp. EL_65y_Pfl1_R83 TaxID=3088697 RepID=UPI0030DCC608